jgi:23S rRNA (pseudouridine1915-N3)-methyltransferase
MSKIELICVGELKFKEFKEIEKRYLQKINFFVKCSLKILKDVKLEDEKLVRSKEAEMMLAALAPGDFVVALDRKGKKMSSEKFADFLLDKLNYHPGRIVFIIGGFAGLSPALEPKIDLKLSFSDMTICHDIFRIVFLEQMYRALTIIKGIKYHR